MKTRTKQEVFRLVKDHLLAQGIKSLNSIGNCAYRGSHGNKCAIGCLLPDDPRIPVLEGLGVWQITSHRESSAVYLTKTDMHLRERIVLLKELLLSQGINVSDPKMLLILTQLQAVHDRFPPKAWKDALNVLEVTLFP
jgi:hypothetical protein